MKTKTFTFLRSLKLLGFAFGFFLWCGSSLASVNGTPENLVSNPGFESGLTGWGSWGGTQTINTTNVHGGTKSMEFTGEGGMSQTIAATFTKGANYVLSAWVVSPDGAPGKSYIGVEIVDANGTKTYSTSPDIKNTGVFEKHEVAFTVPATAASMTVYVYQESNTLKLITDDFSLALAPENLLTNPGFEEASGGYGLWERSAVQSDIFHDGTKAAVVWNLGAPDPGYTGGGLGYEYASPQVGATYTLSAYGKLKNDIGNGANIFIQFKDAGGAKLGIEQAETFAGKDWTMQSVEAVIPEGTTKLVCGIWFDGAGSDSLYMDDFSLVKTSSASVAVTGVSVSPTTAELAVNATKQLVATILPADASNTSVTWSSSDQAIATVSDVGLVKAIAVGTAKITVTTTDGNKTAFSNITVKPGQTEQPNLLVNPGFEEASGGYSLWERSAIQSTVIHAGTKAAVVWNMGAPDPGYTGGGLGYEYLSPVVGGTYKLSAYGKLKNDIGNGANIFIQFKDASGAKLGIEQASTFAGKDWTTQSVEAVIPENTAKLVCGIWFDGSGSDSLYMDDFSLTLVSVPQGPMVGTGTSYKPSYINVTGGGEMPDITNGYTCDCDGTGTTDATACLQAALNEAKAQGKPLLIPYTDKFYKISDQLIVDCSVIGVGGMPVIKQTNDKMPNLLVVDDMTGWIYNLHLIGTYDGTPKPLISYEFGHNIAVRGVNGLTISNNILETPQGDNIGDEGGAKNTVRNLLITNNTLKDAWRCGISAAGIVDRMAIMNNKLYWYSQYVDPIDLEPFQDASRVTNIEVGYNQIESPNPAWLDETHFYEAVLQITAYWDPTPGGNVFAHQNFGNWVAPFSKVTGYLNGPSAWTNILDINNAVGEKIPGSDTQAPVAPKNLAATSVTKTSFDLTWTASTDNTGVVGYLVYKNDSLLGIATASPFKITGLKCGNAYQMAVKAYDADGNASEAGQQVNIATLDCGGGVNLLLNPGFEDGLTSWDDWGGTALESTTVRSGLNSLKTGTGDGGRAQNFAGFTPGSTYVLSAYGMLTGTGDFYKQSAYIGAQFKDAAGAKIDTQTAAITDSINWKQTTLTFTVPANAASVTVFTYYEARGITTNSVLTDDWSLVAFTPVTGVTVDPAKVTLAEGIVKQLKAGIAPETASNKEVIWSSSDTSIVSVSSTGMVQAMKVGMAVVTATTVNGSKTSSCEVTVKVPAGNMLQNPGIEKALSVGWTGDWGNNKVFSTSQHSGKSCLAIGPTDGGRAQALVGFVPGSTYTLSAWCMLNGTGFSTQKTYIGVLAKDATGKWVSNPTVVITDSIDWHQYSVTFTIPFEAVSVDIFAYLEAGAVKTTYTLTDDWAVISGWNPLPYIPTSIASNKMDNFKLYPNPLTGQSLTIEGVEGAKSISIYDMTGRLVMNQSLQKSNNQSIILNEKLTKGSYIVKIATSGESLSKLLIVQ